LEVIRQRDRERYERDKDKRIELVVEAGHRRRARLRNAPSDRGITYAALRRRDGDLCGYCQRLMDFSTVNGATFVAERATIEHVVPLAVGGTHTWDNVILCCWQCNVRKNRRSADEWLTSLRALQTSPDTDPVLNPGSELQTRRGVVDGGDRV
jgi:5-methylcytosine-specific restriction endonuclease McrA